ncbi:MAG TPA: adenylate/guanylate cyclase domain-containing protein, partial [Alphaproteobacteria bacterium]|nr:adenylate/guanylate cyclase domain-containing protein [Alphaproteobacteria bacterium]
MARRSNWLIPAAILVLALVARIADFRPVETLRLALFDEYQRLSPAQYEDAGVRVVDIDDESLARIGQWPWPRTQVAALLDRLGDLGAAVVAFDIVFAEPDRTSPNRLIPMWLGNSVPRGLLEEFAGRLPDHDEALAKAMSTTPTVIGIALTSEATNQRPTAKWGIAQAGDDPRLFLSAGFNGAVINIRQLTEAAAGTGSMNTDPEYDGTIRRVPLFYALQRPDGPPDVIPSLAAEALRVAQNASTYLIKSSNANRIVRYGAQTGISVVRIGQKIVPTDAAGRVWLHDTGPVSARTVPAWQVLHGEVKPGHLEDTIVFVGTSAAGLKDLRVTPLDPAIAGVVAHARIAEQMLLGDFLERPEWLDIAELVYLLAFGILLLLLLPRWGPFACAAIAVTGIAVAFAVSWFAYTQQRMLIDPLYPSLAALTLYLASSLLVFLRTENERRHIRSVWGRYMGPELVEQMAKNLVQPSLGGETRDMTLLFSDIRDFTTISETMDAATLIQFINRFLSPMTEIIQSHRGNVDKYMGDAIMAYWNAPLDDPDHAPNAARAALRMVEELERLNESWAKSAAAEGRPFHKVAIGIGLNTGLCCVGNMGSEAHMDYSVIGDDVNLASRLEGQSKTYGVPIVIGENTRARLDGFAALEIDLLRVKGKQRPVRVFALLGDERLAGEVWFRAVSEAQAAMLKSYRSGDWARASAIGFEHRRLRLADGAEPYFAGDALVAEQGEDPHRPLLAL